MGKIIKGIILTILVSFFVFPADFTFLPPILNSKNILAALGAVFFFFDSLMSGAFRLSKRTLIAGFLAVVFSLWCLYSVTTNGTNDMTYASYWSSFVLWMSAAYAIYFILRQSFGFVDLAQVTKFLAIVGVAQCCIALLIDNVGPVKQFVDSLFRGGDFFTRINRLYGIGCALDPAGCRFSVIEAMIAHLIATDDSLRNKKSQLSLYLVGFIIITVVGSMISRTTIVGSAIGLAYIIWSVIKMRQGGYISKNQVRLFLVFGFLLVVFVILSVGLYRTSNFFRENLRFGFEAFFNWAETGEFRTTSTDILSNMWIWPQDTRTWIIGSGKIGVFNWGTDIGYCNFVLYSGIIGLVLFSAFFIYSHLSILDKFQRSSLLSLIFIALTFIIWTKIMTDIFFIDALLFCIDGDYESETDVVQEA
jgi:hypothetical protein